MEAPGQAAVPYEVLILRDPRESKAKCSLTPLRDKPGFAFVEYRPDLELEVGERVLLHTDGEELSAADAGAGLFLIDCNWRRVPKLLARCKGEPRLRRLSGWKTAYPRRSKDFEDPSAGLASVEALYAALTIMHGPRPELLASYRWREEFLRLNADR